MTNSLDRGRRILAELRANPEYEANYIETAEIGYVILALLERIQRLEEAQQRGKRQEQQSE